MWVQRKTNSHQFALGLQAMVEGQAVTEEQIYQQQQPLA